MSDLRTHASAAEASTACGLQILDWLRAAIDQKGAATLAISGGSSPKTMFAMFAQTAFPWDRVHLFWVDERGVPPTDEQSNFKLANDLWLAPGRFPASNVHRIEAELPPAEAAARYTQEIRGHFEILDQLNLTGDALPRFDAIHRGMGPDAHTASLFPGEPMIGNHSDICAAVWVEKFKQWRITLLPGVLESASHTAMLVTGADKAGPLRSVLHESLDPMRYPAQIGSGEKTAWFLDAPAAAQES